MFQVTATFEGNDREFYEDMANEQAELGTWTIGDSEAICDMGEMTIDQLEAKFKGWSDELEEADIDEINGLLFGEITEIGRGHGCYYEVARVA